VLFKPDMCAPSISLSGGFCALSAICGRREEPKRRAGVGRQDPVEVRGSKKHVDERGRLVRRRLCEKACMHRRRD
jgi:hypothetical protein